MTDVIYVVKVNNGYGEFENYPFSNLNSAKNFARDILDEYFMHNDCTDDEQEELIDTLNDYEQIDELIYIKRVELDKRYAI